MPGDRLYTSGCGEPRYLPSGGDRSYPTELGRTGATVRGGRSELDADAKTPTAETVRQTWWRVRKTLDARQKSAARRGQVQKVYPPPPPPAVQAISGDREAIEAPGDVPAAPRRPLILKPARALAPDENPQDDGRKLPKPFHRR